MDLFTLDVTHLTTTTCVSVMGEIDASAAGALESSLTEVAFGSDLAVTCDLAGITFMDTAGLRALIVVVETAERAGRSFAVVNPSRAVRRIVDVTESAALLGLTVGAALRTPPHTCAARKAFMRTRVTQSAHPTVRSATTLRASAVSDSRTGRDPSPPAPC